MGRQPPTHRDADLAERFMLMRRLAWNLSPLQKFVTAGLWIMLVVNICLWVYHVIPYDTSAKAGTCEASATSEYELPTEESVPSAFSPQVTTAPTPQGTPTATPTATAKSSKVPELKSESRTWTCRQPAPSSIVTTAAIVLGGFMVAEMLVIFGSFSFGAGAFQVSAQVLPAEEVVRTHKNAQQADEALDEVE